MIGIKRMYIRRRVIATVAAAADAAGAGVGGPSLLLARTTCDRHRIVYSGCCRDKATNL